MTALAHIGGLPVEELLPLGYGCATLWAAARAWTSGQAASALARLRGRRR